jgi:hypothetical protein
MRGPGVRPPGPHLYTKRHTNMRSVPATMSAAQGTVALDDMMWHKAVNIISDKASRTLGPQLQSRVSAATALAMDRTKVLQTPDGHWEVYGSHGWYEINGACECKDFTEGRAPEGFCKHRIAAGIVRRASALTTEELAMLPEQFVAEDEAQADTPPTQPAQTSGAQGEEGRDAEDEQARKIPQQYVHWMHGKPHVLYAGLLDMAHERGLVTLEAGLIEVTAEWALAWARATFSDGRVFQEAADAMRTNIANALIAKHYPRMALTRAKARALRDALNIGLVSQEEVE